MAFGLGIEQMEIKPCTERFMGLSRKAFKEWRGARIPFVVNVVKAFHHGKFETRGLEEALQGTFRDRLLFGIDQTINMKSCPFVLQLT